MKKVSKILCKVIWLTAINIVAFTGCTSTVVPISDAIITSTQTTSVKETSSAEASNTDSKNRQLIYIIVPSTTDPFFKAEANGAEAKAEELGYDVKIVSHNENATIQTQLFNEAIALEAVAIICDSRGGDDTVADIKRARDKGIPTFIIEREINTSGLAVSQIVSNEFQGSELIANEFVRLMGQEGNYIELDGAPSDSSANGRRHYYHNVIDQYPKMKMVASEWAHWDRGEAKTKMRTILEEHNDIKGVICENDLMALGAMDALKEANIKDVIVVGFDGMDEVRDSIIAGEIKATVLLPIYKIAQLAVEQANTYIKAGTTGEQEKQLVDFILISKENVDRLESFVLRE